MSLGTIVNLVKISRAGVWGSAKPNLGWVVVKLGFWQFTASTVRLKVQQAGTELCLAQLSLKLPSQKLESSWLTAWLVDCLTTYLFYCLTFKLIKFSTT